MSLTLRLVRVCESCQPQLVPLLNCQSVVTCNALRHDLPVCLHCLLCYQPILLLAYLVVRYRCISNLSPLSHIIIKGPTGRRGMRQPTTCLPHRRELVWRLEDE